jgi:hypothetical protein
MSRVSVIVTLPFTSFPVTWAVEVEGDNKTLEVTQY